MLMTCRPHLPWELLTGSLDASVKRWNFSQGRSLRHWRMEPAEEHSSSQVTNSPSLDIQDTHSEYGPTSSKQAIILP